MWRQCVTGKNVHDGSNCEQSGRVVVLFQKIKWHLCTYLWTPLIENNLYIQNLAKLLQIDLRTEIRKNIIKYKQSFTSLSCLRFNLDPSLWKQIYCKVRSFWYCVSYSYIALGVTVAQKTTSHISACFCRSLCLELCSVPFFPSYFVTHINTLTHIAATHPSQAPREHPCVFPLCYSLSVSTPHPWRGSPTAKDPGFLDWFIDLVKKWGPTTFSQPLTPNICLRSGSRKRKGMFETWRRLGVPLASVESPAEPPAPVPPVPHCTPASPWDVSSVFPCGGREKKETCWGRWEKLKMLMIIILVQ